MSDDRTEEIARFEEERKQRAAVLAEELRALELKAHEKAQLANELQGVINLLASLAAYKPENPIYAAYQEKLTEALHHPDLQSSTSPVLGGYGPAASSPDITPATPTTVITTPKQHLAALQALDVKLSKLIGDERVPESLKEVFRALQADVLASISVVAGQIEEAFVESDKSEFAFTSSTTSTPPPPPSPRSWHGGGEEASSTMADLESALETQQREAQFQADRADAAEWEVAELREELRLSTEEQRGRMEVMHRELEEARARVVELESETFADHQQRDKLETQLASVREESEQKQRQIAAAQEETRRVKSEVTTGSDRIAKLAEQLRASQEEAGKVADLEERLQEATTRADGLQTQFIEAQEESARFQAQVTAGSDRITDLEEQLSASQANVAAQIEAATAEAKQEAEAAYQKRIEALKSQLGLLQSRPDSAPDELQQEIARLKRALEENVTSIKSERTFLQKQLDNKETRALAAEAQVSNLQKQLERLKLERIDVQERLNKASPKKSGTGAYLEAKRAIANARLGVSGCLEGAEKIQLAHNSIFSERKEPDNLTPSNKPGPDASNAKENDSSSPTPGAGRR